MIPSLPPYSYCRIALAVPHLLPLLNANHPRFALAMQMATILSPKFRLGPGRHAILFSSVSASQNVLLLLSPYVLYLTILARVVYFVTLFYFVFFLG
jgi:hypothetical protein